jgi:hypothetical protein
MLGWREWAWRKRPVVAFVKGEEGDGSCSDGGKVELSEASARPKVYHELGRYGHERQELEGLNLNRF